VFGSPVISLGHCPTRPEIASEPCPVEKLKSSFALGQGRPRPRNAPARRSWAEIQQGSPRPRPHFPLLHQHALPRPCQPHLRPPLELGRRPRLLDAGHPCLDADATSTSATPGLPLPRPAPHTDASSKPARPWPFPDESDARSPLAGSSTSAPPRSARQHASQPPICNEKSWPRLPPAAAPSTSVAGQHIAEGPDCFFICVYKGPIAFYFLFRGLCAKFGDPKPISTHTTYQTTDKLSLSQHTRTTKHVIQSQLNLAKVSLAQHRKQF
jgi:hypothetical protein